MGHRRVRARPVASPQCAGRLRSPLNLDQQDPRIEDTSRERQDRCRYQPVDAGRPSNQKRAPAKNEHERRQLIRCHSPEGPRLRVPMFSRAPLNARRDGHDSEACREELGAKHGCILVWNQAERRAREDGKEHDERLGGAPRQVWKREDARQVDRYGHEQKSGQRCGRTGLGDEKVLPSGGHARAHAREISARNLLAPANVQARS